MKIFKPIHRIFLLVILSSFFLKATAQHLKVSENKRFLIKDDGTPFFWMGDTGWELFHKLNRDEAAHYLRNRAAKGFTVIQAVVLAENNGLRTPNSYGEVPFDDLDPTKPNEKYFEHVDFIVNKAEELGLYIGMLPTWGDKVTDEHGGAGPVIFNPENAKIYGEFLGKRYKDNSIIWILGGDRNISSENDFLVWEAMAKGIKKGDNGKHLMTFHPRGGSTSAYWLHNEEWIDFNFYQSGHAKHFNNVYHFAQYNYLLKPTKPFVDGEPAYEDIPVEFWNYCEWSKPKKVPEGVLDNNGLIKEKSHFEKGFFTDYDMRIHAYWNLLSGACGYTYGNNAVWQMFKKNGEIAIPCLFDWKESLDRPGAEDMKHVRTLFEARSFAKLIPDQSLIYGINYEDENHIRAAIANDHSFLIAYLAKGQDVNILTNKIKSKNIKGYWYNPRNGEATEIEAFENQKLKKFSPPTSGLNNDWLLIIEDASKEYSKL